MGFCQGNNYRGGIICVKGHCQFSNASREDDVSHFRMRLLLPALYQEQDSRNPSLVVQKDKESQKQITVICALPLVAAVTKQ